MENEAVGMIFKALAGKTVPQRGDGPPGRPPLAAERYRDILLVVLTLTTGALDAVTFVRLGKVFSSVITGNLALLGIAAGHQETALALDAGLALAGYAAGVLIGGPIAGTPEPGQLVWPVRVSQASWSGPSG